MGSLHRNLVERSFSLLKRTAYPIRCFSFSAAHGVVFPQFQHSEGSSVGASDFIYSHSFDDGPFAAFKTGRMSGIYRRDPRQEAVVLKLQELHERLDGLTPFRGIDSGLTVVDNIRETGGIQGKSTWFSGIVKMMNDKRLNGSATRARSSKPRKNGDVKGLYLYGGVGVGKTMLMDMFVASRPPAVKVMRSHFHDFMLGIHKKLREQSQRQDPLGFVADSISTDASVLALDELFVTDVADAMIINRLFRTLWDNGMVLIATSNRKPDDLYLGGLQRDLFLPFIENLKNTCIVHDMESEIDYRKLARYNKGTYFIGDTRNRCLNQAFEQKTIGHTKKRNSLISLQMRRTLHVPLSAGRHCYFTFEELCGKPVGSADYLGLCRNFHTIFIQDIPCINAANKSAAYRLVTLIDILYDNRVRVLCSAEGDVHQLFAHVISHADSYGKDGESWVVDDNLSFAKERTISRLTEMESMEYLVEHANRHAPELLLALAEIEENSKEDDNNNLEAMTA